MSFKCGISSYICLKFLVKCLYIQPLPFASKYILHVKFEKKLIDNACFFTFFTTLGLIWPRFCPKDTATLRFFAGFQWNMLKNSIDINNFNWNLVVPKNFLLKPLNITIFWSNFSKNGVSMGHNQNKKTFFFFFRNNKTDHKLSKTFYFIKTSYVPFLMLFC